MADFLAAVLALGLDPGGAALVRRGPAALRVPDEPLVGAEAVHQVFRGWLAGLGHSSYALR
ncbi:MAG TPA: hypothetical protein VKA57_10960 [Solirubrobacteraceae bacterium]|nr:hypothetical protein [Solirubrobacteraceae bacterium]